MKVLALL